MSRIPTPRCEARSVGRDQTSARRLRLPLLVPVLGFKPFYALVWAPYIAIYQLTNRFPLREPIELPMTVLDSTIPFLPELLPVYVSYLAYFFWTVARQTNDRDVTRIFYATHLQLAVSVLVFVTVPVRMPRELFYASATYNWADAFWRWFDAPNNCLPSLHAANVLLLMQINWARPYRWWAFGGGAAIIASTLFVKQHYVVDLVAGGFVYLLAAGFLARLVVTGVDNRGNADRRGSSGEEPRRG